MLKWRDNMGLVMVCKYKRTKTPLFVEQAGLNLYSLEELAYFLYHNIYLVDRSFFNEKLCRWIREDAGDPLLADSLEKQIAAGANFQKLASLTEEMIGLYGGRELEELKDRLKKFSALKEQEKIKFRADELLNNQNEWAAMEEYRRILRMHQNARLGMALYADVWNNLGVCYVRQFVFDEAARCFDMSCEYRMDEAVERQAELARKLSKKAEEGTKEDYESTDLQKKLLKWEREYRIKQKV